MKYLLQIYSTPKYREDFERLPVITKDELIAAYPDGCVSRRWPTQDLFCTRSSGSSG